MGTHNLAHQKSVGGSDCQNEYRYFLSWARWLIMQRCQDSHDRDCKFARCSVGHYVRAQDIAVVRSSRILNNGDEWHGAYYDGIIHCDNWLCPICGRQIARTRCAEIGRAGVEWVRSRGTLVMITLTIRHRLSDSLSALKSILDGAMQRWRRNNSVGGILKSAGMVGRIRSYEVQYGQVNGYHPHCHNLYFLARSLTGDEVAILKRAWVSAVVSSGGEASWEIGLVPRDVSASIGDYLTKVQSISAEMALGNLTKDSGARSGHYSPMQLLGLAARGSSWAGDAYREEVLSMRGVHWVDWSQGLKARFGIAKIDDDEARAQGEAEERRTEVAAMSGMDYYGTPWRSRGRVLDVVAASGLDDCEALRSAGVRVVPGRDLEALPRLELVPEVAPEVAPVDVPDVPDVDVSDVAPADVPDMPDMPEAPAAGELPTADLPSPTNCVGKRPPPIVPDSPPLPFDSDLVPYPLAPLGTTTILRRNNPVTDTNFNQGGNNHDN